jgi:hypothetical protein
MQEASTRTILYLIRHGQTDYNASQRFQGRGIDAELNAVGRKQAEAVARYFEEDSMTIDRLYCSSLKRTAQTAGPLAHAQNLHWMKWILGHWKEPMWRIICPTFVNYKSSGDQDRLAYRYMKVNILSRYIRGPMGMYMTWC